MIALSLLYLYLIIYREKTKINREGKSKGTDQSGRKRTRAAPRRSAIITASYSSSSFQSSRWQGQGSAKEQAEGKEEREPGRRMPPTSSPVPRLSSAPSDASTVHTIASRSPLATVAPTTRARERAAASSGSGQSHRHTSPPIDQQTANSSRAAPRAVGHPARIVPVLFPSVRW